MRRFKQVLGLVLLVIMVLGVLSVALPAESFAKVVKDPDCAHPCQPMKKHNGVWCTYVGCDPATGMCIYAC